MSTETPSFGSWSRGAPLVIGGGVSALALFVAAGPLGVLVAVLGVAGAIVTTGVLGVAMLHLGAVALVDTPTMVELVLLETAAAFLLVVDVPPGHRLETGALFVPVAVGLAVAVTTISQRNGLPTAVFVLVGCVVLGTYLFHRYARLRLGLTAGELET